MKVLFMGTPAFAAASLKSLLEAGHQVCSVITRPDARSGRGLKLHSSSVKELALAQGLPVLQPRSLMERPLLDRVAQLAPELIVVVAFGRILPADLLEAPPRGAVNLHASLLPRYRGAAPIAAAILDGERETGVTTIKMTARLDAGDILLQRATSIGPEETAGQLEARLAEIGSDLLVETLAEIASGNLKTKPQDESRATYAPVLKKQDGIIDWSQQAEEIARRVRAYDPWPAAQTRVWSAAAAAGPRLRVWRARVVNLPPRGATPGTILPSPGRPRTQDADDAGVPVACGGVTALILLEVQPEGGRRMPASQAVSGRYLREGDRLGGD